MSFVHQDVLATVLRRLRFGQDVLLTGDPGSGRSTVLRELAEPIRGSGRSVVELPSVPGGDAVPLGAFLSHPRFRPHGPGRFGVPEATAALTEAADDDASAVLIDDAHRLDAVSASVVAAVTRRRPDQVRIVATAPLAAPLAPRWAGLVSGAMTEQLEPLGVHDVSTVAAEMLGGPVDVSLATALTGRSGGNPQVVRNLATVAVDAGAITMVRGRWAQTGSLDNLTTTAVVHGLLADLDDELRQGLEVIAWFGLLDIDHARKLLGDQLIGELDRAGRIAVHERPTVRAVAVSPPVLGHALRLQLTPARRALLRARSGELLGTGAPGPADPQLVGSSDLAAAGESTEDGPVHQQVTIISESVRTRAVLLQRNWAERHDVASALPLVRLHVLDGVDSVDVDELFARTSAGSGDAAEDIAAFVLLRGEWAAQSGRSIRDALGQDPGPSGTLVLKDPGEPFLQRISRRYRSVDREPRGVHVDVPTPVESTTTPSEVDLPVTDQSATETPECISGSDTILRVQDELEAGAPDRALDLLGSWQGSTHRSPLEHELGALRGDALLMAGQVRDAAAWARSRLSDAYDELSPYAVRLAARGLATALFIAGDGERALRALSLVLRIGRCGPLRSPLDERIFALGAVLHARAGRHELASTLLEELKATPRPYVPVLDFMRPWAQMEVDSAASGEPAAEPLWAAGERLWQDGRRASAAICWALTPTQLSPARLERLTGSLSMIKIPVLAPAVRLHRTLSRGTSGAILEAAKAMRTGGPILRAAVQAAQRRAQEEGTQLITSELVAEVAGGVIERSARASGTPQVALTSREQEIVALAREGLSNREIASRLFLSVRTVESHLYRAMQKLEVSHRSQLTARSR